MSLQIIEPDYTWDGRRFVEDVQILVSQDGWIEEVGQLRHDVTHRLVGQALIPGLVSAHSHAFQRGLRGFGERLSDGPESSRGWFEKMCWLATTFDPDRMYSICRQTFSEMLAAGITTVGEFHYLRHHEGDSDFCLDNALLEAAHDTGIRVVLLSTFYRTSGSGQHLVPEQAAFATPTFKGFWAQMDKLESALHPEQHLGVAAHSIPAVPIEEIRELSAEAKTRGQIFHIHLEEQRREIEDCLVFYDERPLSLILENCETGPHFTAIHGTHSPAVKLEAFLESGGNICLCPLSEANSGGGLPSRQILRNHLDQICLGTDSNTRISMHEELRWLELTHRLDALERGIWLGKENQLGRQLLQIGTQNGARALGIKSGRIQPGYRADFVSIDLNAPSLEGCEPSTLVEALLLGADTETVASTWVGGKLVFSRSWLTQLSSM